MTDDWANDYDYEDEERAILVDPALSDELKDDLVNDRDYEVSTCPICDKPDCTFPPECRNAIGVWPEPTYGGNE